MANTFQYSFENPMWIGDWGLAAYKAMSQIQLKFILVQTMNRGLTHIRFVLKKFSFICHERQGR